MAPASERACQETSWTVRNTFLHFSEPQRCTIDDPEESEQPLSVRAQTAPPAKLASDQAVSPLTAGVTHVPKPALLLPSFEEALFAGDTTEGESVEEHEDMNAPLPHVATRDWFEEEWEPLQRCASSATSGPALANLREGAPSLISRGPEHSEEPFRCHQSRHDSVQQLPSAGVGPSAGNVSSLQWGWQQRSHGLTMPGRMLIVPTIFPGKQMPPSPAGSMPSTATPPPGVVPASPEATSGPTEIEAAGATSARWAAVLEDPRARTTGAHRSDGQRGRATRAQRESERTTVMLRNLPNNYSREALLEMIDAEGFAGRYDFLYFPIDFRTHAALGYAFLNLVTPQDALEFQQSVNGFSRWSIPSTKVCTVGWSHPHQGLEQNVARYRNSPLMHETVPDAYRPVLFHSGVRIAFPAPTKKVKPPRQGTERMLV